MKNVSIYWNNVKISWKTRLAYPGAFVLAGLCQMLGYFTQFFTTWILLISFNALNGWNTYEVIFLYAMQLITYSIAGSFASNTVADLPSMVRNGQIDELLIKPIPPLPNMLTQKFNPGYLAHFTFALIMMIAGYSLSGAEISIAKILLLVIFVISGAVIVMTIMLITTFPCLYLLGTKGWWGIFYDLRSYTNYPITIFDKVIQVIFTWLIPFAFAAYYPARFIFTKSEGIFPNSIITICSPLVAILLLIATKAVWEASIKKYNGAGS